MIYTNFVQHLKCSIHVVRVGHWFNVLELACGKSKTIQDKKQNIPYLMF